MHNKLAYVTKNINLIHMFPQTRIDAFISGRGQTLDQSKLKTDFT